MFRSGGVNKQGRGRGRGRGYEQQAGFVARGRGRGYQQPRGGAAPPQRAPPPKPTPPNLLDTVNIGVLKLDVEAKSQIINLFNILDTDKNGKLEQADFELAATHGTISRSAAREKFFHLRAEMDYNDDGEINPEEFVRGLLKSVLKDPLSSMGATPSPSESIVTWILKLEAAANHGVKELCKRIHHWLISCTESGLAMQV